MKRKFKYKKPVRENISMVRDGFSKYMETAKNTPVVILDRKEPKSILIDYEYYQNLLEIAGVKPKKNKSKKDSKKKKYTSFQDFIGIANPSGKKIDINKEIEKAWTQRS